MATDLKRNSVEKEGSMLGAAPDETRDDYSPMLNITLEEPEMQKTGFGDLQVGDEVEADTVLKVVSKSDDNAGRSVTLQVRQLGRKEQTQEEMPRETVMYGDVV